MTVFVDASALLARHLQQPARSLVIETMAADAVWCASALCLTETLMLVERVVERVVARDELRRAVRDDWDRVHVVPVDALCLDRAAELGCAHPIGTVGAVHLAAADRLPRPLTYLTLDRRQIPVGLALGFDVVSP